MDSIKFLKEGLDFLKDYIGYISAFGVFLWLLLKKDGRAAMTEYLLKAYKKGAKNYYRQSYSITNQNGTSELKDSVLDFIFQKIWNPKKSNTKLIIILAPSGQGKSALLTRLYIKYRRKTMFTIGRKLIFAHTEEIFSQNSKIQESPKLNIASLSEISFLNDIFLAKIEKTILLLDAFDEINFSATNDITKRQNDISEKWKLLLDKVKNYRMIVLTVREQFFDEYINFNDILRNDSYNDFGPVERIKLALFNEESLRQYLFNAENRTEIFTKTWDNWKALYKRNYKLAELFYIPLIASYSYDLLNGQYVLQTYWDILNTIVQQWLKRENKTFDENNDKVFSLINFSVWLAEYMAKNNLTGAIKITELEYSNNIPENVRLDKKGFTHRTLLLRDEEGWRFSNQLFYEYFLAYSYVKGCQERVTNLNGKDLSLCELPPFTAEETIKLSELESLNTNSMLFSLIFGGRWAEARYYFESLNKRVPQSNFLTHWDTFFENIFPEGALKDIYRKDFLSQFLTINVERTQLISFENLKVSNHNFFSTPGISHQSLSFFNDWVTSIYLSGSNITLENFKVLQFCGKELTELILVNTALKGAALKEMKPGEKLNILWIPNLHLTPADFAPFSRLQHLKKLNLKDTELPGHCLQGLVPDEDMNVLALSGIKLTPADFAPFSRLQHLKQLTLDDTELPGHCLQGLVPDEYMDILYLSGIKLTPADFAPFSRLQHLKGLNLNNTELPGHCLQGLVPDEDMETLCLEGIKMSEDDFKPFMHLKKLTKVNLKNTGWDDYKF